MRRLAPRLLPQIRILLLALLLPASPAFLPPPPPPPAAAPAPTAITIPSPIPRAAAFAPRSAAVARPGAARAASIAAPHLPYPRAFTTAAAAAATGGPSSSFMEAVAPTYIEPEELLELLKAKRRGDPGVPKLQIVDVRDDDYEGGRLPGAINVPSEEWGDDEQIDALVAELKGHRLVVFHCMLSQVRGPFCAKRFMARLSLVLEEEDDNGDDGGKEKKEEKKNDDAMMTETGMGGQGQVPRVCVLRYGYQRWYERYRKEIGMVVPCDVDDDEEEEEED